MVSCSCSLEENAPDFDTFVVGVHFGSIDASDAVSVSSLAYISDVKLSIAFPPTWLKQFQTPGITKGWCLSPLT